MAFVNEVVSEDDVKKHELDELRREFYPFGWRSGRPAGFTHTWTIDRERNIYFVPVKTIEEVGRSGLPQPTTKQICILDWQGKRVRAVIDRAPESSTDSRTPPYRIVWQLLELDLSQVPDIPISSVVQTLKEALTVYGDFGAHHQVPNTIVEFKF